MKYIVFGGDGFVGRHLTTSLLEKDEEVLICDIAHSDLDIYKRADYQQLDIRVPEQLAKIKMNQDDIVINLAANQYHLSPPRKNRYEYFYNTNYKGTENILAEMDKQGCHKFIYYSTDMTYGKPHYLPVDVNHPQNPFGPYGASKKASEDLIRQYRAKGFKATLFRPRMILGPGRLGILKKLFRLFELNLPVPMIGNGTNCYQMISVFDCVSATLKSIEKGIPNSDYNLGSDNPPTVYDLLSKVIEDIGSHSILIKTPGSLVKGTLSLLGSMGIEIMYNEQYEIADENYIVDISNAKEELEWSPKYNDIDMLYQAYEYYKKDKDK